MLSSSTSCMGSVLRIETCETLYLDTQIELDGFGLTFEGSMEKKAARADKEVAHKGNEKYCVMAMVPTADDAFVGEVDEQEICHGIDNFCCIGGCVVVLEILAIGMKCTGVWTRDLFAPIES